MASSQGEAGEASVAHAKPLASTHASRELRRQTTARYAASTGPETQAGVGSPQNR